MRQARWKEVGALALTGAMGLLLGAALARWAVESLFYGSTFFYGWLPTMALALLAAGLLTLFNLWLTRHCSDLPTTAEVALAFLPFSLLVVYLLSPQVNPVEACVLLAGTVALAAALLVSLLVSPRRLDRIAPAAVFALALALYLKTLAPTVGAHDTFEFQVLSYELGIAHPTGYPLYVLLGKLFTLVPLGNVAYRVNLSSALFAAGAVTVLYSTITWLTRQRSAGLIGALSFAFTYSFWSQAVEAEVYALNALFVAVICYLLLRSFVCVSDGVSEIQPDASHSSPETARRNRNLLIIAAFVYGVSLTHHRTMLLLGPAIVVYATLNHAWRLFTPRTVAVAVAAFVGPLVGIHLYVPVRWAQIHGVAMSWPQFTDLVLGTQFSAALRWGAILGDPGRWSVYLRTLLQQYPGPALLLAAAGVVYLAWKGASTRSHPTWKAGIFLLLAFAACVAFGLSYYVPDVSLFLIPSHMVVAVAIGLGVSALRRVLDRVFQAGGLALSAIRTRLGAALTLTLVGMLPVNLVWLNMPRVDKSNAFDLYDWGTYVLAQDLPPNSVILADSEKIAPLDYLQSVEHVRSDTETGVFPDEDSTRTELERLLAEGRPVLLARFLPGLEGTYHLRSLGPLAEVSTAALVELPADVQRENVDLGDGTRLVAYRLDADVLERTDSLRLTLFWQAGERSAENLNVRLRLVGPTGHVWIETKGRPPVNGLYPTGGWTSGEIVSDFHQIDLEGQLPPGSYDLQVGLFAPFPQPGLASPGGQGSYLTLTNISVSSDTTWQPQIDHPLRATFADKIMLRGYDLSSTAVSGLDVPLALYWQALDRVNTDLDVVLELVAPGDVVVWRSITQPLFGEHPTSAWSPPDTLVDVHQIEIPGATSGPLELRIGLRDPVTGNRLKVVNGWLATEAQAVSVAGPSVAQTPLVSTGAELLPANFENKIMLLDYHIQNVQVRKGDALHVTFTWQALSSMDEDYTVFVHLLDEHDRIWGQEDLQPVYGTHPTSQWAEAEIVVDPHTVWTDEHAPLGLYRVEVGLYLLRTMERLQLLDSSGNAFDDRLIIDLMEIVP
jgi:hypothetical protein